MANRKDYYDILGVPKGASEDEIKKAYRNMAREHHPDMVDKSDKEAAEKRFKEINEAYQVLKDPQKRKMYDQFGNAGPGFNGGRGADGFGGYGQQQGQWGPFSYSYTSAGGAEGFDPFDIFEEFFGFRGFGGQQRPRKGKNLYYEMHIDFVDAVRGAEKNIKTESGPVKIKVPAGVHDGTEIKFVGKGMSGPNGAPNGDLYITVRVPTPRVFTQRAGNHFGAIVEIDFVQATLGDTVDVPVIDAKAANGVGKAKLKIPAGTQPHTQFRLKGKGMPGLHNGQPGDIVVQVHVNIPKKLNKKQKKLLEEYRDN